MRSVFRLGNLDATGPKPSELASRNSDMLIFRSKSNIRSVARFEKVRATVKEPDQLAFFHSQCGGAVVRLGKARCDWSEVLRVRVGRFVPLAFFFRCFRIIGSRSYQSLEYLGTTAALFSPPVIGFWAFSGGSPCPLSTLPLGKMPKAINREKVIYKYILGIFSRSVSVQPLETEGAIGKKRHYL